MGYDCSITKRKGCNYCLRSKQIPNVKSKLHLYISDYNRELQVDDDNFLRIDAIKINYCPVCGKKLEGE